MCGSNPTGGTNFREEIMLKKFFLGSVLAQAFIDPRSGPERLAASGWSKATTPEELIAAHILHEFAKNPDKWEVRGTLPTKLNEEIQTSSSFEIEDYKRGDKVTWYNYAAGTFTMTDGMTILKTYSQVRNKDGDGYAPWFMRSSLQVQAHGFDDPPVNLPLDLGQQLVNSIRAIIDGRAKAERVAAEAKAQMEENERRWNMAERLLGMRRNEQGALEPINN